MISKRYNIKNWTRKNLSDWFKNNEISSSSVKSFRADQVFNWLYQKRAESFDQMLNIGPGTRKLLEDHFEDCPPCIAFLNTYKSTTKICREALNQVEIPEAIRDTLLKVLKDHKEIN